MASPQFDLRDKTMLPIKEDVPTATEINFRHTPLSTHRALCERNRNFDGRKEQYANQYPPKRIRFSRSGVPLVKEKE
jgi:hypothetical protein